MSLHRSIDIPARRSATNSIDCSEWNMWQKNCWITEAVLQTRSRKTLCAVPAQREPTVMWTTTFPAAKIIQGDSQCCTFTVSCSNFTTDRVDRLTSHIFTESPTQCVYIYMTKKSFKLKCSFAKQSHASDSYYLFPSYTTKDVLSSA